MRFAFSTLGVPAVAVSDVARLATENGFEGVEVRTHPEEPVHVGLSQAERADVVRTFEDAGVRLLCLAGYARMAAPGADGPVLEEVRALLELARDLGAAYVRVFPGGDTATGNTPQGAESAAASAGDAAAVRRLSTAAPLAADLGVRLLLETHDSHRRGEDVARVLDSVGHPSVGALWDVLHTWLGGESPARSCRLLRPHLGYLQVKDVGSAAARTPLPPGSGVLPLAEAVDELARARSAPGGEGNWLCWEYEKRWFPEVPALEGLLPSVRDHLRRLVAGY